MADRTIDEAEYAALAGVNAVVTEIMRVPAARQMLLRARKTANPDIPIPEIDAAAPVITRIDGAMDEIRKLREDLAERDRKADEERRVAAFAGKWDEQKAQLRRDGWRLSGIDGVVKYAEEHGIADLTIAADSYAVRHPEPTVMASGNGAWNMFNTTGPDQTDTFVEDMMKSGGNDERRLDREIADIIRQARTG